MQRARFRCVDEASSGFRVLVGAGLRQLGAGSARGALNNYEQRGQL